MRADARGPVLGKATLFREEKARVLYEELRNRLLAQGRDLVIQAVLALDRALNVRIVRREAIAVAKMRILPQVITHPLEHVERGDTHVRRHVFRRQPGYERLEAG